MELCFESATLAPEAGLIVPACRAAVSDLRHLEAFLRYLGEYRTEQTSEPGCWLLADLADRAAPRLADLASELEAALSR